MDATSETMAADQPAHQERVMVPNLQFPAADDAARRGQGVRPLLPHEFDWTVERVETLTRMWEEGHSQAQIAEALGLVSRSAIGGKIYRLGLARHEARRAHPRRDRAPRQRGRRARTYHHAIEADASVSTVALPEGRLYFEDLTPSVCHFPVGAPPYLFCGAETQVQPYCRSCAAIARAPRG